jgi:hypothetical protein
MPPAVRRSYNTGLLFKSGMPAAKAGATDGIARGPLRS